MSAETGGIMGVESSDVVPKMRLRSPNKITVAEAAGGGLSTCSHLNEDHRKSYRLESQRSCDACDVQEHKHSISCVKLL